MFGVHVTYIWMKEDERFGSYPYTDPNGSYKNLSSTIKISVNPCFRAIIWKNGVFLIGIFFGECVIIM